MVCNQWTLLQMFAAFHRRYCITNIISSLQTSSRVMDMYNRKIHGNKSFVYTMLSNDYAFKYLEENSISKYISKFFYQ